MSKIVSENEFEKKRIAQLDELRKQIIGESPATGNKHFKVFSMEAAMGKTTTLTEALAELYQISPETKSLVITPFKSSAEYITERINFLAKEKIAIDVNCDNKKEMEPKVKQSIVVVITHKRYLNLCQQFPDCMIQRTKYRIGRENLIIDEEMDLLTATWTISAARIRALGRTLREHGLQEYKSVSHDIHNIYDQLLEKQSGQRRTIFWEEKPGKEKLININKVLRKAKKLHFNRPILYRFSDGTKFKMTPKKYKNIVRTFYNIINSRVWLVDKNGLSSYFSNMSFWRMDNNIILDASAYISSFYDNEQFDKVYAERIQNHSQWKLWRWHEKSTKNYKDDHPEFHDRIVNYLSENITGNDKALIIGQKDEVERINTELENRLGSDCEYEVTNFKAMRGKNNWEYFNKCFVIQTPYEPFANYVFRYLLLHENTGLSNYDLWLGKRDNGVFGFVNNEDLEHLKETSVYSSIYQGIKRVNRKDFTKPAEITIISNNDAVFNVMKKQLTNVQIVDVDGKWLPEKIKITRNRESKLAKRLIDEFKFLIKTAGRGEKISKREIMRTIRCKDINNLLHNPDVIKFLEKNAARVDKRHTYFIFNQNSEN